MEFLTSCAHPRSPENMVEQRPQLSYAEFLLDNWTVWVWRCVGIGLCRTWWSNPRSQVRCTSCLTNLTIVERVSMFFPQTTWLPLQMLPLANAIRLPGAPAICMDTHLRTSARPGEALHPMHWEEPEYRELPEQLRSAAATGSGGRDLHQLRTQEWWASSSEVFRSTQKLRCLMFSDVG